MGLKKEVIAAFDPAMWEVIYEEDLNPPEEAGRDWGWAGMSQDMKTLVNDWRDAHDDGAALSCDHCGQRRLRFVCYTWNATTNEVILLGQVCATRADLPGVDAMWRRDQERATASAKARAKLNALRDQWNADHPEAAAILDWYQERDTTVDDWSFDSFLGSMVGTRRLYGALTARQEEVTLTKRVQIEERMAKKALMDQANAERDAALAQTADLEEGRRELHGRVLHTKWQDSDFGGSFKMLVELDDLNRVWGTVPSHIEGLVQTDDQIMFTATVERSDTDSHFGFFKRPTKAVIKGDCDQCGKPVMDHWASVVAAACVASVDEDGAPVGVFQEGAN